MVEGTHDRTLKMPEWLELIDVGAARGIGALFAFPAGIT
jgi:hypothetical protein